MKAPVSPKSKKFKPVVGKIPSFGFGNKTKQGLKGIVNNYGSA